MKSFTFRGLEFHSSRIIIVSLKNTPHDYYPTFPDNPQIGHVGNHAQWIEFDTWGQFYGAGFFPAGVVEDMQRRMTHCFEQGATGIYLRTDWENLTECSVFNSFNLLNLIAGAKLSSNLNVDIDEIYRSWVEYGLLSPLHSSFCIQGPVIPTAQGAYIKLRDFMKFKQLPNLTPKHQAHTSGSLYSMIWEDGCDQS